MQIIIRHFSIIFKFNINNSVCILLYLPTIDVVQILQGLVNKTHR